MAAALVLVALGLLLDRDVKWPRLVGAFAAALAALLSKESAVLALVMLLTLDLARWRRPGAGARYASLLAALVVYVPLRRLADLDSAITPTADSLRLVAASSIDIAAIYGGLLVWPWPLTPARHLLYLPPLHQTLFGLAVFGVVLGLAISRARDRTLAVAGLLWAALAWAPTLAATLDKGLLGERYLYLPLAGLGLTAAAALPATLPWRWLAALTALAVGTIQMRLPDWQDSRTVWERAHAHAPTAFTAGGLAWYYHRDRDLDAANALFVMALQGDPPYRDVCDLILSSHMEARQTQRAVELGRWAIEERGCPRGGLITGHYAVALAGTGRWDEAVTVALNRPGGTDAPGLVVVAGGRARAGDLKSVVQLARQQKDPVDFAGRVAKLLRLSGEADAAARVTALIRK